ncbi:PfkB family carbohydrate kinase [Streptomyces sp. NPDC058735]|uniref:PfkB family carbohydrate kinase n=1 Tax=Streptomyces sp. NPDC058735 TaxID=3346616 RepID=UPI00369E033C
MPDRDAYRTRAERLVAAAYLVKASDEDLAWLHPDLTPEAAAQALLDLGPRLAVITRGARGTTALTTEHQIMAPAPPTHVVDTIGAGDALQACLLDTLLQPDGTVHIPATPAELETVLRRCVTAGALTCTRAGGQPPTGEEITAALAAENSPIYDCFSSTRPKGRRPHISHNRMPERDDLPLLYLCVWAEVTPQQGISMLFMSLTPCRHVSRVRRPEDR